MGPLLPVRCLAQRDAYVIYTELIGRPFIKRFALRYRTVVCLSCLSVCDVGVLWQNAWMDQDDTRYGGRPRPGNIVLDGDPAPPGKGHSSHPIFGPCLFPAGTVHRVPCGFVPGFPVVPHVGSIRDNGWARGGTRASDR